MADIPYEIERKYLIRYPSVGVLSACSDVSEIIQTYLLSSAPGVTDRVRARRRGDKTEYTHTVKKRISDVRREEYESIISEQDYQLLLLRADAKRNVIKKTRYILEYKAQPFEIDVYGFWSDRAVMELEISDESQEIVFPPDIELIREISSDRRYTNASLAMNIPYDEI